MKFHGAFCNSDLGISRNSRSFLKNDDISRDQVSSFNLLFFPTTKDCSFEGDTGFEMFDNISGLLFLIPSDTGVSVKKRCLSSQQCCSPQDPLFCQGRINSQHC